MKNFLNLIKKQQRKLENLINKKSFNLNEEIKKKTNCLLLYKR